MALLTIKKPQEQNPLYLAAMESLFTAIEKLSDGGLHNQLYQVSNKELDKEAQDKTIILRIESITADHPREKGMKEFDFGGQKYQAGYSDAEQSEASETNTNSLDE